MGVPEEKEETAFLISASGALGSIVANLSFSTMPSSFEVSPRTSLGICNNHWPLLELKARSSFGLTISILLTLLKSMGSKRLSRRSFRPLSKFVFAELEIKKTRGSPASIAYEEPPVGRSSPTRSFCGLPSLPVAETSTVGSARPYTFRSLAFSSITRSVSRGDSAYRMVEIGSGSPINGLGDVIFQFAESVFERSTTSPAFLLISSLEISSFWKEIILTGALAAAFAASSIGLWRLDQKRAALRAARTMAATINCRIFIAFVPQWNSWRWPVPGLSSSPPDGHAGEQQRPWQQELAAEPHPIELCSSQGDVAGFLFFRTDGNQIFIRGKPVQCV